MSHNKHNAGRPGICPISQSRACQCIIILRTSASAHISAESFRDIPDEFLFPAFPQAVRQQHGTRRPNGPAPITVGFIKAAGRTLCRQARLRIKSVALRCSNQIGTNPGRAVSLPEQTGRYNIRLSFSVTSPVTV